MQNRTKPFIYIFYDAKKYKYEKENDLDICVSTKKIVETITKDFPAKEQKMTNFILVQEDESFSEQAFIDFFKYNQKEFVLMRPCDKLKNSIAQKKAFDETKEKEPTNLEQNKATLVRIIAKATKAKVEMKVRKPVSNKSNEVISNFNNNAYNNLNGMSNQSIVNRLDNLRTRLVYLIRDSQPDNNNNNNIPQSHPAAHSNNNNNIYINQVARPIMPLAANLAGYPNNQNGNYSVNNNYSYLVSNNQNNFYHAQGIVEPSFNNFERSILIDNEYENDEEEDEEKFEECLSTLIAMGFECEGAAEALREAENDLQYAIEILVNSRSRNNNAD